uniref:lysylphosphatidylglycerol synthase domain-containing protein n=1 Tax=Trichocoleus desertorum TaxID=1481672 RepID=UPI0025B58F54|nr:lysylphosphatidylglycerol synthase domain-containing protein [Trichocoleus desertorum]
MKQIGARLKPYLRWVVLGGTLIFLAKALKDHWADVVAIRIEATGWLYLAIALSVTLMAHIWSGWVWGWILRELNQPVNDLWAIAVYLRTNVAKYLPGNIWHFYGRTQAATAAGISLGAATLSVLLEPLLMAAAALLIALVGNRTPDWGWQIVSLGVVLASVHPKILNLGIQLLSRLKGKATNAAANSSSLTITRYPLRPLLGEMVFVGIRGLGFLFTFLAISPLTSSQIPPLFSAFALAWLLGLVVPGAPGGIGVFEATAIALLNQQFSPGLILSVVALYRLISILAESIGAGFAYFQKTQKSGL